MIKKRTKEQIEESVKNGDYTGGYDFLCWLIFMRLLYVIPLILMFSLGLSAMINHNDDMVYKYSGLFFICASIFLFLKLIQNFRNGKKGISE